MWYEILLEDVKRTSKDSMKKIIFQLEQEQIEKIKQMNISSESKKELILLEKDRTFLDMLLTNALLENE